MDGSVDTGIPSGRDAWVDPSHDAAPPTEDAFASIDSGPTPHDAATIDAPTPTPDATLCAVSECAPGAVEAGSRCGYCGTTQRTCGSDCRWGAWACTGMGECEAGAMAVEAHPCGSCGGSQTRTRTCDAECHWQFSDWSACSPAGECTAGQTETRSTTCGNCDRGRKTQTRTCSSSCTWGAWTDSSACTGAGECAPGATRACANGDSCGVERCDASCNWDRCAPRSGAECLRIGRNGVDGSNFRCCTMSDGGSGWQFCRASCQWNTCEAHSCG